MPRGRFKHDSLPTLQISVGIIALFEKIYHEEPSSQISGRLYIVQYRCFS
jgi:hypothetical protein